MNFHGINTSVMVDFNLQPHVTRLGVGKRSTVTSVSPFQYMLPRPFSVSKQQNKVPTGTRRTMLPSEVRLKDRTEPGLNWAAASVLADLPCGNVGPQLPGILIFQDSLGI